MRAEYAVGKVSDDLYIVWQSGEPTASFVVEPKEPIAWDCLPSQ